MRPGLSYREATRQRLSFHLVLSTRLCRDGPTSATVRNEPWVLRGGTSTGTVLAAQPPTRKAAGPAAFPTRPQIRLHTSCTCTTSAFSASCLQPSAADERPLICSEPSYEEALNSHCLWWEPHHVVPEQPQGGAGRGREPRLWTSSDVPPHASCCLPFCPNTVKDGQSL